MRKWRSLFANLSVFADPLWFHPDRNGGDRAHESALQAVVEAYQHLRRAPAFV